MRTSFLRKPAFALAVALLFYWLVTFGLLVRGLAQTDGKFIYPIDDTYIHMAIAKHFVQNGAWSVSSGLDFTSTTSSPLWTLLVAGSYAVFGVNELSPLLLNLVFGSAAVVLSYNLLRKKVRPLTLTVLLVLIVLFVPLPILTLGGMEHTLHSWLSLWLLFAGAAYLHDPARNTRGQLILLMALSALVSSARYEGLFLVAIISLFLLLRRRVLPAFLIGGAGLLPVVGYGLLSLSHGWDFLPTSLMLKGNTLSFSLVGIFEFLSRLPTNLLNAPHILLLLVACLIVWLWLEERGIPAGWEKTLLALYLSDALLHMLFASTGWFYRYESYLVLAGLIVLACVLKPLLPAHGIGSGRKALLGLALALLLLFPLGWRSMKSFFDYPFASQNIYQQHYQMAMFLQTYYNGRSVAANDIGAINYYADIRCLDLYGLGTVEVTRAKRAGSFDSQMMVDLVEQHGAQVLILYDITFAGQMPAQWIKVGEWTIPDKVVVGSDTLAFYAPSPAQVEEITAHLRDFSPRLPEPIIEIGLTTNSMP